MFPSSSLSCLNTQKTPCSKCSHSKCSYRTWGHYLLCEWQLLWNTHQFFIISLFSFFFSPCTCMWCKEAWLPIRDEKSGRRTILRFLGIPEAWISQRFSALKMLVITMLRLKAKTIVSYLEISPWLGVTNPGWRNEPDEQVFGQDRSGSPDQSCGPWESPVVSLSLVSDNLQKGEHKSCYKESVPFPFYSGHNTFIHAEWREPQNHRLPDGRNATTLSHVVGETEAQRRKEPHSFLCHLEKTQDQNMSLTLWPLEF